MKKITAITTVLLFVLLCLVLFSSKKSPNQLSKIDDDNLLIHWVDPTAGELHFFWKDKNGDKFLNFENLKSEIEKEGDELIFAVNGGMYKEDFSPQGLFIEDGVTKSSIDRSEEGYGNFYLQPNGIFYLTADNNPVISTTTAFKPTDQIEFATQSGPMLVINDFIHKAFREGSNNLNIRNGVGILPDGKLLFTMSKVKVNLFDFASFFQSKGCSNALYLDGFVSKTYLPSKKWEQLDGTFGVIIAQVKKN